MSADTLSFTCGKFPLSFTQTNYVMLLLASLLYGKPACSNGPSGSIEPLAGAQLVLCILIFQLCLNPHRTGRIESAKKLPLLFTTGMFAVIVGWYIAASIYNSNILGSCILYMQPEDFAKTFGLCHPAPMTQDIFKTLQVLGADALLVGSSPASPIESSRRFQFWLTYVICGKE
jgi:hypothetical protein